MVLDGINGAESSAVAAVSGLKVIEAQSVAARPWFSDGISGAEVTLISTLATLSVDKPATTDTIVNLPWVVDGLTDEESRAISQLAFLDSAEVVTSLPWFADGSPSENEVAAISSLRTTYRSSPALASQIVSWPFFRDSIEEHDLSAITALRTLSRDAEDWALLTKQGWYQDGISDEEGVLLTVLPGQAQSAPGDYLALVTKHFIEKNTVPLPLSGEVDLYIVRFLKPTAANSGSMVHMNQAAAVIEEYMGFPLPKGKMIVLFGSAVNAGGYNYGTHVAMDIRHDNEVQSLESGLLIHELLHFYRGGRSIWFNEGTSNFMATLVQNEIYGFSVRVFNSLSNCPGDAINIQQITQARRSTNPNADDYKWCYHSDGEHILRTLERAMGAGPFQGAWREIHQRAVAAGRGFTDEEIYQIFLSHAGDGTASQVTGVFLRYHTGSFLE